MKKHFDIRKRYSVSDLVLIISSFVFFTVFFIFAMIDTTGTKPGWAQWETYVAFIANIINIANLLLTIKKRISSNYFGLVNAVLAGLIAWRSEMFWQMIRYWVVCVVGTIITLVVWIRNSKDKKSVETKYGSWKFFWILLAAGIALAILFAWMETTDWFVKFFHIDVPMPFYLTIFDGLSLSMLAISIVFISMRLNQYWIFCYIMYAATLGLWIVNMITDPKTTYDCWQMLLGTFLNIGFTIKGHIDWVRPAKNKN